MPANTIKLVHPPPPEKLSYVKLLAKEDQKLKQQNVFR